MEKEIKNIIVNALNERDELTYHESHGSPYWEFDVYANYQDKLSDDQIKEILSSDDPKLELIDILYDVYADYTIDAIDEIKRYVFDSIAEKYSEDISAEEENEISDFIHDFVFYNLPEDHYLDQEVNVDILVNNGDNNYDFTLHHTYPMNYGSDVIDEHAGIVLLAKLQGYSLYDLRQALAQGDVTKEPKTFLESVRSEIANQTTSMGVLTFLAKVSLADAIELQKDVKYADSTGYEFHPESRRDCGYITIAKNAFCGLYDPWNGAGSDFDIKLEKAVKLPIKYIYSVMPDSCRKYSVESIYGMDDSAWKRCIKTIKGSKER